MWVYGRDVYMQNSQGEYEPDAQLRQEKLIQIQDCYEYKFSKFSDGFYKDEVHHLAGRGRGRGSGRGRGRQTGMQGIIYQGIMPPPPPPPNVAPPRPRPLAFPSRWILIRCPRFLHPALPYLFRSLWRLE